MSDKLKALDEKLQPLLLPLKDVDMPTADAHKVAKVFADILEACIDHFHTRPVPDPEQQEGLRVALEAGWKLAARYVLECMCQIEGGASVDECVGIVRRTREAISKAMLERETMEHGLSLAALASPKADPKTELTDAEIDAEIAAVKEGLGKTGVQVMVVPAFQLRLCARAKRCNALEREVEEASKRRLELHETHIGLVRERNALAKQVETMREALESVKSHGHSYKQCDPCTRLVEAALAKGQPAEKVCTACMDEGYHGESQYKHTCKPADGKG